MRFTIWSFFIFDFATRCSSAAAATTKARVLMDLPVNDKKCRDMPKASRMDLIRCCSMPEIFKSDVKAKCIGDCSDPDFRANPWCCMTKCLVEETEVGANGTVDRAKAKALFRALFASINNQKVAENAVDKCESEPAPSDSQTEECDFPDYAKLLSCVTNELFRACPYTVNEPICLQIKTFLRICPSRRSDLFAA